MKIKRIFKFFLIGTVLCLNLMSCTKISEMTETLLEEDASTEEVDDTEFMVQCANVILEGMKNNDAEAIAELYCTQVQEDYPQITEELQKLIDWVDGEIVSYDEPTVLDGSASWREGEYVYKEMYVDFSIETSEEKNYSIDCVAYTVCRGNPEWVGVMSIDITDTERYTYENGCPEDAYYQVFYEDYRHYLEENN